MSWNSCVVAGALMGGLKCHAVVITSPGFGSGCCLKMDVKHVACVWSLANAVGLNMFYDGADKWPW